MGCSCNTPKAFKVEIDGKERIFYGLEQVVFTTILSFPDNDGKAADELWNGFHLYNETVNREEEASVRKALMEIYVATKKEYDYPDSVEEPQS